MPYVNIKIAGPEPTKEQKDQVFKEVTETLVRVLGKKKRRL
ncbi:tautomerase family protein [Campylobacter concisus]